MAITLDAPTLATILNIDAALATRLLAVSSAMILAYCETCPDAIHNEATIRTAAYLRETPGGAIQRLETASIEIEFQKPTVRSPLRLSGAMALLSPFKIRRAAVIR